MNDSISRINKKEKILVALSGGVDSAVAAALLKKRGYEIVGAYFSFFSGRKDGESAQKAKKIAETIGIPFQKIDAKKEFKKRVVDQFISSYKKGLTPNPCVVCNKEMKFRMLFDLMKKNKFQSVATGHYARLRREFKIQNSKFKKREDYFYKLLTAKDETKDQSYFLYRLTQKDLSKIALPLGSYLKSDVRKLAKKFKLPVLEEKESQDICFAGNDIQAFLRKNMKLRPGSIVDESGKIIGRHRGLPLYTLGQRKGIHIGGTGPYFVMGKNSGKNELAVTNDPKKILKKEFWVKNANWIDGSVKFPLKAKVQIRYHAEKVSAIIKPRESGELTVKTKKPLRAVTPGQSAVFYINKEVLGGGIIA